MKVFFGICGCLFLSAALVMHAQAGCAVAPGSPADYYKRLVENYDPTVPPKQYEAYYAARRVAAAAPDEVRKALPWIIAATAQPDDEVKGRALLALFSIAQRSDGTELIRPFVQNLAPVFNQQNERLQTAAILVLSNLRPLPEAAFPLLLRFLQRTSDNTTAQAAAVSVLLEHRSEDPGILEEVERFLAKPLIPGAKVELLRVFGLSSTKEPKFRSFVFTSLDDPDASVRYSAIRAVSRMDSYALLEAERALRSLVQNPRENASNRNAAVELLEQLDRKQN